MTIRFKKIYIIILNYLNYDDTHIGIVDALNTMTYAHNELPLLPHSVHKLHRMHSGVIGLTELACCCIQRSSKTISL